MLYYASKMMHHQKFPKHPSNRHILLDNFVVFPDLAFIGGAELAHAMHPNKGAK
jgi:hypothetical protein